MTHAQRKFELAGFHLNANCIFSKFLKRKVKLVIIPRKGFRTALVLSDHVGRDGNEFINQKLNERCQTRAVEVEEKGKMERLNFLAAQERQAEDNSHRRQFGSVKCSHCHHAF